MFIGCQEELNTPMPVPKRRVQLVVLYGRRRIGKTELLRQFCKGNRMLLYRPRDRRCRAACCIQRCTSCLRHGGRPPARSSLPQRHPL